MDFGFPEYEYDVKNVIDRMSIMIDFVDFNLFSNISFNKNNFSLRLYNPFIHGMYESKENNNFVHI